MDTEKTTASQHAAPGRGSRDGGIRGDSPLARLLERPDPEQAARGYRHTLREICQQPETWRATARHTAANRDLFSQALNGIRAIALTGSGSSEYAGACLHLGLRKALGIAADTVPAGLILTHGSTAIAGLRPALVVSLARSGDSPESCAALEYFLRTEPDVRHLVITCNPAGRLAVEHASDPRVHVLTLDPRTCDRSLAMTSSFTNMVLAGGFLGLLDAPGRFIEIADGLAGIAERILSDESTALAGLAATGFTKGVFLGSGSAYAAAREGGLKMLELTSGRVTTMAETPLGLRHGPMSWVDRDTVVMAFLSSDSAVRAYERDLLEELDRKGIGQRRVLAGDGVPDNLRTPETTVIECPGLGGWGDEQSQVVYVLVAQLLAFFRCLEEGLKPDAPSETGVISRVVEKFRIYARPAEHGMP